MLIDGVHPVSINHRRHVLILRTFVDLRKPFHRSILRFALLETSDDCLMARDIFHNLIAADATFTHGEYGA